MKRKRTMEILGKQLLRLRREHGLTQREMADRLQIGVSTLRMLEHGELPSRLTCDFLFTASAVFQISPGQLFADPE